MLLRSPTGCEDLNQVKVFLTTSENELSAGLRTFAYDLANRVKQTTPAATTTSYLYDGEGKRLQASTGSANSAKTNFLWDPSFGIAQLARETNGAGTNQRRYAYGHRRISMVSGFSTRT